MKLSTSARLLVSACLALFIQTAALAHTALQESTPADAAIIRTAPAHLDLVFNGPVKLIKFELMGVGHEMPTKFEANTEAMASYRIETPGMHPGAFTVNWAVIGADGHTVTDSYSFTVDPDAPEDHAAQDATEAHGHGGGGVNPH